MRQPLQGRLLRIEELLRAGSVSVPALSKALKVSEMTIRRDLAALERDGKLMRVYGGAIAKERVAYEFSFKEKESLNREAKESIGRAAAALVEPGAAVFLDTGTTSLEVARALRSASPGVIVTINLCVASEYVGQDRVRVIMPGGEVGHRSPDLLGELTLQTLSQVTVDTAFLGCDSFDRDAYYATDLRSAAVSRLMLERSRRAFLIVDSSKFGRKSMIRIAPMKKLAGIVTDRGLPAGLRRALERGGMQVVCAAR